MDNENKFQAVILDRFPFKTNAAWLGLLAYLVLICILLLIFLIG
jgi:hypothetical protein